MAFWKPGTTAPGSTIDRETEADGSLSIPSANKFKNLAIDSQRKHLPIYAQRDSILYAIENNPVLIIIGQTGSGKTTQIPQYLHESGWAAEGRVIACTQPRRVAATSVANRVAQEVGCVLGDEVGYTIRFEDLSSPSRTRIKYLTDGMLFREALLDPLLSKYSIVMIDEAHERTPYTDLLLGILKKIRQKRPELRLIISSATLDAETFQSYYTSNDFVPQILNLLGRVHPIEIAYLEQPTKDYIQTGVDLICQIHIQQPPGDILVFLTGREEIDQCVDEIAERLPTLPSKTTSKLLPMPLHAGLTSEEQLKIFDPPPPKCRKVVISTNIAEASVTIDGIKYVVDSGLVKLRTFNPKTSQDVLSVTPCSIASLNQRAGRAGRTSPGKCFRLFPESALDTLPTTTPPEICRSDLSQILLQLKALGIANVARFDWLSPPPSEMVARALELLYSLGALDDYGRLTPLLGMRMAEVPVNPMMAKILLGSHEFGCTDEMLSIAAMTSVQNVFIINGEKDTMGEVHRRAFIAEEGDHLTLLNVYEAFKNKSIGKQSAKWCHNHSLNFKALSRAVSIRSQLRKYLQRFDIPIVTCGGDANAIRRCLVSGYFKNAARVQSDGTYQTIREGATLHVHPSSVMFTRTPPTGYVIFHEIIETTKSFVRDLTVIEHEWLTELAPHYYESR